MNPAKITNPTWKAMLQRQRAAKPRSAIALRVKDGIGSSARKARTFAADCVSAGLPAPVLEYAFHATRRWRFDLCWPNARLAIEVEGGVYITGAHNRAKSFLEDIEKYNAAVVDGWRLLRVTPDQLLKPQTLKLVRAALEGQ